MGFKPWTYGLFLASLGHFLAPLPLLSAAHASENKNGSCEMLFPNHEALDMHKAYQHRNLSTQTYEQIFQYAMERSKIYTQGLVFIATDNSTDAQSMLGTFKSGDRFRFHDVFSLNQNSEHYIGKKIHHLHELEMMTHIGSSSGHVKRVILIGTVQEFEQYASKIIQKLLEDGESQASELFWEIFPTLSKTNIFIFRSPVREDSYADKVIRYMGYNAYDSQGKVAVVEYSAAQARPSTPQHRPNLPSDVLKENTPSVVPTKQESQPVKVLALPAPQPVLALPAPGKLAKKETQKIVNHRSQEPTERMLEKAKNYVNYLRDKLKGKQISKEDDQAFRRWIDNLKYRTSTAKESQGKHPYSLDSVFTAKDRAFLLSIDPHFFGKNDPLIAPEIPLESITQLSLSEKAELYVSTMEKWNKNPNSVSPELLKKMKRWLENSRNRTRFDNEGKPLFSRSHYKIRFEEIFNQDQKNRILKIFPGFFKENQRSTQTQAQPTAEVKKQAEDYVLFIEKMKRSEWVNPTEAKARIDWLADINTLMELPENDPQKLHYTMDQLFTEEQKARMAAEEKAKVAASIPDLQIKTESVHDQRRHEAIASLPEKARTNLELITERIRSDEFEEMGEDFLSENPALENWFQTFIRNNRTGVTKFSWLEYFTYEELLRLYNYSDANTPHAVIQIPESVLSEIQQHYPGQLIHRTAHLNPVHSDATPELVLGAKKIEPKDKDILKQFPLRESPTRILLPENTKGLSALEIAARALEQMEQQNSDLRISDHPELEETPVPQKTKAQIASFNRLKKSVEEKYKDFEMILARMEGYFTALHELINKGRFSSEKLIFYTDIFQLKKKELKEIYQRIQDADEINHLRAAEVMMISIRSALDILEKTLVEENKNMGAGNSTFHHAQKDLESNQQEFDGKKKQADSQALPPRSNESKGSKNPKAPANQITQALQKAQTEEQHPSTAGQKTSSDQDPSSQKGKSAETEAVKKTEGNFLDRMFSLSKKILGLDSSSKESPSTGKQGESVEQQDTPQQLDPSLSEYKEKILQQEMPQLKNPPTEAEQAKISSSIQQWTNMEASYMSLSAELKKFPPHPAFSMQSMEASFVDLKSKFQLDSHLLRSTDRGSQLDKLTG